MDAWSTDESPTDPLLLFESLSTQETVEFVAPQSAFASQTTTDLVLPRTTEVGSVELLSLPTLIPTTSAEGIPLTQTLILQIAALKRRPVRIAPSRSLQLAIKLALLLLLSAATGSILAGLTLGGAVVAGVLVQQSGGVEPMLAGFVNRAREAIPGLTSPIERLEVFVQELAYDSSRLAQGAPVEEPTFVLPTQQIAGTPDIPDGGPHNVPVVTFDPAILSVPLQFAPSEDGPAWMSVARPVLNDAFPNDAALVLKFDMRAAEIHWMAGRQDPWPVVNRERQADVQPPPDRSGRVPMSKRTSPFVVFGGGFQSMHFPSQGARWQGRDVLPMRRGLQTLAIYSDGHTAIGPWGEIPSQGVIEARQNLPPLVHEGKIPADIAYLNIGTMSAELHSDGEIRTYTNVHTWRSALGILENGDLVYVLAARVTPQQLAATLIRAGAVEGMQLDINAAWHASPTLCTPEPDDKKPGDTKTAPLFTGTEDGGRRFVTGAERDFFFIGERAGSEP